MSLAFIRTLALSRLHLYYYCYFNLFRVYVNFTPCQFSAFITT